MGKDLIYSFVRSRFECWLDIEEYPRRKKRQVWGHTIMPTTKSVFSDLFLLHYKKMKINDLQLLMVRVNPE